MSSPRPLSAMNLRSNENIPSTPSGISRPTTSYSNVNTPIVGNNENNIKVVCRFRPLNSSEPTLSNISFEEDDKTVFFIG